MDVIFREPEPYLPSRVDSPFGDSSDDGEIRREGEKCAGERSIQLEAVSAHVLRQESVEGDELEEEEENMVTEGEKNCAQGELRYVYQRRRKENVSMHTVPFVPSSLSMYSLTPETPTQSIIDLDNIIHLDSSPLMLRRTSRSNARNPPDRYGFPHSIDQYIDYSNLSIEYRALIASLDSIVISKCW
jgi:hypothetical protein